MRIAFIVPSLQDKAPVYIAVTLAKHLNINGNLCTVYFMSDIIEIDLPQNIEFKKISFFDPFPWSSYDIVHTHMIRPDLFGFIRKPINFKGILISTIHCYIFPELTNLYNKLISVIFGRLWLLSWTRFDALTVLTKNAYSYYNNLSYNKNIYTIYNGRDVSINLKLIESAIAEEITTLRRKHGYVLGMNCGLIKRKGVHLVIQHLSRVENGCLVVFGSGIEFNNLLHLVDKLKLSERVKFYGFVPNAHLYNYFFDVFLMPSNDEGFGLSLIEAACHKKKIVCSDIPVFRELFTDQEVTFFDLNKNNSIDNAILNSLLDNEKPDKAFKKAISIYSEKTMSNNFDFLFNNLLKDVIY
jgi:glycosyltransferase involved in cell wall biosynthesis